jgi:hypothetical protein
MSEYQYHDFRAIDRPQRKLMTEHSRRKAFITRLEKAGLR